MPISRNTAIEIISALIILLFVYTALSKLTNWTNFQFSLAQSPLVEHKVKLVAYFVPISELLVSLLLLIPRTRLWGFYGASALMLLFTGYVAYLVLFVPHVPCACGGIMKILTWPQHLLINSIYTALAITGIFLERKNKRNKQNNSAANFVPASI